MKILAIVLALLPLSVHAANITVTGTADNTIAGNGKCTLREAIANVNAAGDTTGGDCVAGSGAGDTIHFGFGMPARIRLVLGQLSIQRDVSIENFAPGSLQIDGQRKSRVFEIVAGTTSMHGLTIERGKAFTGGGIGVAQGASLNLVRCVLKGNTADADESLDDDIQSFGGAIYNEGTLHMAYCLVIRNAAGGVYTGGYGGGIYNTGASATLFLSQSAISRNTANGGDGGEGIGGGIYNKGGSVTLNDCTVTRNKATFTETSGYAAGGGINNLEGVLTLSGCRVTGNRATGYDAILDGGGIYNGVLGTLNLADSIVARNAVISRDDGIISGGGIYNEGSASLSNCTIDGNLALATVIGENYGGGIDNDLSGSITLTNCTLSRNATIIHGEGSSLGGGIFVRLGDQGQTTLTNCTLAGNRARSCKYCDASGGGVYAEGNTTLTNCTLNGNTAQPHSEFVNGGGGGGLVAYAFAFDENVVLTNTIVANSGVTENCLGKFTSGGHNLSSDGTCFASGGTDLLNLAPQLTRLENYGGPTQTQALCSAPGVPHVSCSGASPAINAGDDSVTGPPDNLESDQRGFPRHAGTHVDIGAYEAE